MPITLRRPCRCSHDKVAHEHYRSGTDCALCGCESYRGGVVLTVALGTPLPPLAVPQPRSIVLPDAESPAPERPGPPLPRRESTPDETTRAAER